MKVDVPLGDVVDRATILRLKRSYLRDPSQRRNVENELAALEAAWASEAPLPMEELHHWKRLFEVNQALWDVEDALREHERRSDFGSEFVRLARAVYALNDQRAALKKAINLSLGSSLVEEKSYGEVPAPQALRPIDGYVGPLRSEVG